MEHFPYSSYDEFREPSSNSARVVRIYHTPTPRVLCFVEKPNGERQPAAFFIDEINDYVGWSLSFQKKRKESEMKNGP